MKGILIGFDWGKWGKKAEKGNSYGNRESLESNNLRIGDEN
jgi:hypothetical protein